MLKNMRHAFIENETQKFFTDIIIDLGEVVALELTDSKVSLELFFQKFYQKRPRLGETQKIINPSYG